MDAQTAVQTEAVLGRLTAISGAWGERRRTQTTPEFVAAAGEFQRLTGVQAVAVLELARKTFLSGNY